MYQRQISLDLNSSFVPSFLQLTCRSLCYRSTIPKTVHFPTNFSQFNQCPKHLTALPSNQDTHIRDLLVATKAAQPTVDQVVPVVPVPPVVLRVVHLATLVSGVLVFLVGV